MQQALKLESGSRATAAQVRLPLSKSGCNLAGAIKKNRRPRVDFAQPEVLRLKGERARIEAEEEDERKSEGSRWACVIVSVVSMPKSEASAVRA